ncbi:MAG TPA: DMT family transporter [Gammaproteobacteria bacterium]
MLWIAATLIAAAAQTARNAMQSSLTASLGTLGAAQVRFLYGLPFALLFLVLAAALADAPVPAPTASFVAYTGAGALAQIAGTVLLLAAMHAGSFSVATAFTKTEPVQVAIFAFAVLGERLTPLAIGAIVIATAGVVLAAWRARGPSARRSVAAAAFGVASGAFFALAAVGFRGGILALGEGSAYLRATTTLAWALGLQAASLGAWMAVFRRAALVESLLRWRQSLTAGFMGALASQFWFLGFSLTAAANVRTLALVEVLFAHAVARRLFGERACRREALGMTLVVAGVALLLASTA